MNQIMEKLLGQFLGTILEHPALNKRKTLIGAVLSSIVLGLYEFDVIGDSWAMPLLAAATFATGIGFSHKITKAKAEVDSKTKP